MAWRKVGSGRSKATAMPSGLWSLRRFTSIEVKPKTALVTWPDAVAMSVGRAKKALYARLLPSSNRIFAIAPDATAPTWRERTARHGWYRHCRVQPGSSAHVGREQAPQFD